VSLATLKGGHGGEEGAPVGGVVQGLQLLRAEVCYGRIRGHLRRAKRLSSGNQLVKIERRYNLLHFFVVAAFHEQGVAECRFASLYYII
jgi:hypothetical protein